MSQGPLPQLGVFANEWLRILFWLFLATTVVVFFVHAAISAVFPFPLDYGEAPLVDQALRLSSGLNIYRADISEPPFTVSNYPPLYILVLTPFVKLFGPSFFAGRMISVLCTLAAAIFLVLVMKTLSEDRVAAFVTGIVFLAIPYVVHWSGFLRVDMLALALSTAAMYVVVRWPKAQWSTVVAAVLLVAAIYTRQSYALAAPLAAFVWLWTQERRRAIALGILVGGLSLLLLSVLNLVTRGGFLFNIVSANVNEFGMDRLGDGLEDLRETVPALFVLGTGFVVLAPAKGLPGWPLLVPYLVGAFLSALTVGKIGSNVNYFLELAAALSLAAGASLWWSRERPWLRNLLLLILVLQIGWLLRQTLERPVAYVSFRAQDRAALDELNDLVAEVDGPVLADEHMGLMTLQERPLYLQPFEVTQLARAGDWNQTLLLTSIENREFSLIIVYQFPYSTVHEERWTPEMLTAIEQHYTPQQNLAGNVVYRPTVDKAAGESSLAADRSRFHPPALEMGPRQRISDGPYVFEPHIAVNQAQPDHLAATVVTASQLDCEQPECATDLQLYTSADGGLSWAGQAPFQASRGGYWDGMPRFEPNGRLHALALDDRMRINSSAIDHPLGSYHMVPTDTVTIPSSQVFFKPWLVVDPRTADLLVTYTGRYQENIGIRVKRSTSHGAQWTYATAIENGVPIADFSRGQATPPLGAQLLFGRGEGIAAVWTWGPGSFAWPLGVWMAESDDGGWSFAQSRQIGETWGLASAVSHAGVYYVAYRRGSEQDQELVLAVSDDGGATWATTSVSGELPVATDWTKAPGISVAPNGTIDVAFYAQNPEAGCTLEMDDWQLAMLGERWVDTCAYDAFYAYSKDGGQTFSTAVRLNLKPILGDHFVRFEGFSLASFRLGIASSDGFAQPIWIETPEDDGTQAFTVRIQR